MKPPPRLCGRTARGWPSTCTTADCSATCHCGSFSSSKLSRHRGVNVTVDDILITSGSQTAAVLINTALLEPGDTVVSENFSYVGMLGDLRARGVNIVGVPVDEDGMRMDALADTLTELQSQGVRPKYLYTIPTVQNPTGPSCP